MTMSPNDETAKIDVQSAEGQGPGKVPLSPATGHDTDHLLDSIRGRRIIDVTSELDTESGVLRSLGFDFDDGSALTLQCGADGMLIAEVVALVESDADALGTVPSDRR
ncbi:MAG TPA: hypothetical protein VFK32_01185 [Tepidiformaceae bacterium]|nr:hypothetical protein [Tepidiformaceae bacterium]